MTIDWNKLSPDRFEQLCSEIIESEGFYNIRRMGGSGDRGRDIIAQRESQLLYGAKEIQNWIIQCKRYINTNLTIDDISSELNKVRMHNPDYYLIMLSNTLKPNVYDWLEGVKPQYPFKILVFDVDWLEKQLNRQTILIKRYFENQEKRDSHYSIRNSTDLQVYTAGKMPSEAIRNALTWWRENLEYGVKELKIKIGFYHPEFAGCDHSGIYLSETVQNDFRMISQSNLIIAYLETDDQFGTITEIMTGYSMNKQLAIFVDESILTRISVPETEESGEMVNQTYYDEVYEKVFKTNHSCPCDLMNELEPIHMNNYWFMIEFLRLRQPDTYFKVTSKDSVVKDMIVYLKEYIK